MLEKLNLFIMYSLRGGAYATILILLSMWFLFLSFWLHKAKEVVPLILMSKYISQGLLLLALGSLVAAAIVWLTTWISDYRSDYLPSWVRRRL